MGPAKFTPGLMHVLLFSSMKGEGLITFLTPPPILPSFFPSGLRAEQPCRREVQESHLADRDVLAFGCGFAKGVPCGRSAWPTSPHGTEEGLAYPPREGADRDGGLDSTHGTPGDPWIGRPWPGSTTSFLALPMECSRRQHTPLGTRCCCCGCRDRCCCGWPSGNSWRCCSRNRRAGHGDSAAAPAEGASSASSSIGIRGHCSHLAPRGGLRVVASLREAVLE